VLGSKRDMSVLPFKGSQVNKISMIHDSTEQIGIKFNNDNGKVPFCLQFADLAGDSILWDNSILIVESIIEVHLPNNSSVWFRGVLCKPIPTISAHIRVCPHRPFSSF